MKYQKTPFVIAAIAVMLVSVTFTFATTHCWVGNGSGACGELHPWGDWQGCIAESMNPEIDGTWQSGLLTGTISGDATYNQTYDYYFVSNGQWDTEGSSLHGSFTGYFCVTQDTAYGYWWDSDNSCNGTFWGHCTD